MTYADRYREELAYFRADLPILTAEKIAARCHTLSLLLTAAVRQGEIAPPEDTATPSRAASFSPSSGSSCGVTTRR